MAPSTYLQVTLQERPPAEITSTTFKQEIVPFNLKAGPGQILVKILYLSLDPALRGAMRDQRSYMPPVKIGAVMRGTTFGEVLEAGPGSKFKVGDIVEGAFGEHRSIWVNRMLG